MSRKQPAGDDAPLGALEEQVLVAVLRTIGESYGMSVRREIERLTQRELAIGAVYATLDRLEAKGLLDSKRGVLAKGGQERRLFTVTRAGLEALAYTRKVRDSLWKGVNLERMIAESRK